MKITAMIIGLLITCSLSAQQPDMQLEWKKNSYVFASYSLGDYGTVYLASAGKISEQLIYVSANGTKVRKTDKERMGMAYKRRRF